MGHEWTQIRLCSHPFTWAIRGPWITPITRMPTFPCEANDLNNKNDERIAKGYVSLNYNPNFLSHGFTQIKHIFSGGRSVSICVHLWQENFRALMQRQCKIRVVTVLTFLEEIEQKETKITKVFLVRTEQNLCCLCYLLFRIWVSGAQPS